MRKQTLLILIFKILPIFCLAQSVKHVFMPYEVKYKTNANIIDSLTEENIVILNDNPVIVKEIPITYKSTILNEQLYNSLKKNIIKDSTTNVFLPTADSILGYYYRIDAPKGKNKFGLGTATNGVFYKLKKQVYYITLATGSIRNKILIFRVDKNKLSYVNQFSIPGNRFQNGVERKKQYLNKQQKTSYLNLPNELPLTLTNTGQLLLPLNLKEGNLKGVISIDINKFLTNFPYNEKVDNKEEFVKIYGSRLDENKNTNEEYVQSIIALNNTKIWASTNTAKIILLDTRYPSQSLLYDMNSDTILNIKDKRTALIDVLKEQYNAQYLNNKIPTGDISFKYFNTTNWKQLKNTPAGIKNYKKCATTSNKNNTKKCTFYPYENIEKNSFVNEYLLKSFYKGKGKVQLVNINDTCNQKQHIQQAITMDENGDIYVVSNFEISKFSYQHNTGKIMQVWSKIYKNNFIQYAGNSNAYNGTPATIFGKYVAITDQSFPNVNLQIFNKTTGKLLSTQQLFEQNYSKCDNAIIANSSKDENDSTLHSLLISNNFGTVYPLDEVSYTQGGLEKYYFSENNSNNKTFEKISVDKKFNQATLSNKIDAKTATPLLRNNVVFLYNQQQPTTASNKYLNWQLQALDFTSGNPIYNITPFVSKNIFKDKLPCKTKKKISKQNYTQAIFNNIHNDMTQTPVGDFIISATRGLLYLPTQTK